MGTRNLRKPLEMMIEYADSVGDTSRRKIRVEAVEETAGRIYLQAWCTLYDAPRTFRADRIITFIDEKGTAHPASEAVSRALAVLDGQRRGPRKPRPLEDGDRAAPEVKAQPMTQANRLEVEGEPSATAPAAGIQWGQILFWVCLSPGVILVLVALADEKDAGLAAFVLAVMCGPVILTRTIFRAIRRRGS